MSTDSPVLTAASVGEYLLRHRLITDPASLSAQELGGGVSNIVILIEGPHFRWVLKQSLGQLRVKEDWYSDRDRIFAEANAIVAFREILGSTSVPKVLHLDRENFLFIMTAAPVGAAPWKNMLLAGHIDLAIAQQAGDMLSRIITASHSSPRLYKQFQDRRIFDQLRVTPYYRTTASRHPDVIGAFEQLISDSWRARVSLVHGDYSPKNMLVCEKRVFLIDFEVIHWGDPSFDAGFLLTHLFLKAFHRPQHAAAYVDAAREFWGRLDTNVKLKWNPRFENLTIRHVGGLMLARIDGKSPVEYIADESSKEQVRRIAKTILLEPPTSFEALVSAISPSI